MLVVVPEDEHAEDLLDWANPVAIARNLETHDKVCLRCTSCAASCPVCDLESKVIPLFNLQRICNCHRGRILLFRRNVICN